MFMSYFSKKKFKCNFEIWWMRKYELLFLDKYENFTHYAYAGIVNFNRQFSFTDDIAAEFKSLSTYSLSGVAQVYIIIHSHSYIHRLHLLGIKLWFQSYSFFLPN